MKFRTKKKYGSSKLITCPFCDRIATHKNEQAVAVCHRHSKSTIEEIKCSCGSWLEQRSGKYGAYFNCINCGNINFNKGMELKALHPPPLVIEKEPMPKMGERKREVLKKNECSEITITSKDVEYF